MLVYLVCALLLAITRVEAQQDTFLPNTFLINPIDLVETRQRVLNGDPALMPAFKNLITAADFCLEQPEQSVISKNITPPSGSKHDYYSIGTYWWPCNWNSSAPVPPGCNITSGEPWVRRDGEENPYRHVGDSYPLGYMSTNVSILSFAYWFTQDEKYALKATEMLEVWFLNSSTKMNPNMNYAQFVPGHVLSGGIIDARYFFDSGGTTDLGSNYKTIGGVMNAVPLLKNSSAWDVKKDQSLQDWFREYLRWLLTSPLGTMEYFQPNNHGDWYDSQCLQYALFLGDDATALNITQGFAERRIATQIMPNGTLPYELARTKAFWYSFFALCAFWDVADTALYTGVDVWHFNTTDDRNFQNALDFLIPYAIGTKPWPYSQIIPFDRGLFFPIFRRASRAYNNPEYEGLIQKLPNIDYVGDVINLLFPRIF